MGLKSYEHKNRSIAKAFTYRIYQSFIISPIIVYILTQDIPLSFKFGVLEAFIKIPAYFLFERIWALNKYGYKKRFS